jgi:hypothetical protein
MLLYRKIRVIKCRFEVCKNCNRCRYREGVTISSLTSDIWRLCSKGELGLSSAPGKAIFYSIEKDLSDNIVEKIMADQQAKREKRMKKFTELISSIENDESVENIIKTALSIT